MSVIAKSMVNNARRYWKSWLFLGLIILFVVFVRIRLLDIPLERDEGEYAYMGQLILQGIPPYGEAYNMKFPGTYLMYAVIMAVFGQTVDGIHIGLMIINCATIWLVYLLARKMLGDIPAAFAGGTYGVLSLSPSVFGFAAHATHFVVLPALGGTLLLLHALEKDKIHLFFLSGTLLGISVIMKQPGIFFVFLAVAYILYNNFSAGSFRSLKKLFLNLSALSLGVSLPLLITALWLYAAGVFDRFWFWTVVYASKYASQVTVPDALDRFKNSFFQVVDGFFIFWIVAALGLVATFFHRGLSRVFVALFALFSFLSICPGFYFREHYYITLLPAVSLLSGILIDFLSSDRFAFLKGRIPKLIGVAVFIAAAATGIIQEKNYFFYDTPLRLSGLIYFGSPFAESMEIARFIKERTTPDDRIAVFGSEPEIFFYAKRRSATGYIYSYSLMEAQEYALAMQKEMIAEIEASNPKFFIDVIAGGSWGGGDESENYVFRWAKGYIADKYSLVGVVDLLPTMSVYKWYDEAKKYSVQSPWYLLIYERR